MTICEQTDGFRVSDDDSGVVRYFKKDRGWTLPLVEEAVDSFEPDASELKAAYDDGYQTAEEEHGSWCVTCEIED